MIFILASNVLCLHTDTHALHITTKKKRYTRVTFVLECDGCVVFM